MCCKRCFLKVFVSCHSFTKADQSSHTAQAELSLPTFLWKNSIQQFVSQPAETGCKYARDTFEALPIKPLKQPNTCFVFHERAGFSDASLEWRLNTFTDKLLDMLLVTSVGLHNQKEKNAISLR